MYLSACLPLVGGDGLDAPPQNEFLLPLGGVNVSLCGVYLSVRVDRKVPKERHKEVEGLESTRRRIDSAHPSPSLTSPFLSVKSGMFYGRWVGSLDLFPWVSYGIAAKRLYPTLVGERLGAPARRKRKYIAKR